MNIYFACSITGGREFEKIYQHIVAALEADGHHIPTSHLAQSEVVHLEKIVTPTDVFTRDIGWIDESHAVVAEISTPSHGVGYEIAYALSVGKPVLGLYAHGRAVSKMLTGNTHKLWRAASYHTPDEAVAHARGFLSAPPEM